MRLFTILSLLLLLAGCSSDPDVRQPRQGDASPLFLDFTQPEEPSDGPVDPATCKHAWVPSQQHSHPYQTVVNGMPMPRMCFAQRCTRCGKVRHECERRRRRR